MYLVCAKDALAGSRTRIYCLEGNNANRYTTNAHLCDPHNETPFIVKTHARIPHYIANTLALAPTISSPHSIACAYNASSSSVHWRDGQVGSLDFPHLHENKTITHSHPTRSAKNIKHRTYIQVERERERVSSLYIHCRSNFLIGTAAAALPERSQTTGQVEYPHCSDSKAWDSLKYGL